MRGKNTLRAFSSPCSGPCTRKSFSDRLGLVIERLEFSLRRGARGGSTTLSRLGGKLDRQALWMGEKMSSQVDEEVKCLWGMSRR